MKQAWRKILHHGDYVLAPADEPAQAWLDGVHEGQLVYGKLAVPRSVPHHRWFFGLLQRLSNVTGQDVDYLRFFCLIKTGHTRLYTMPGVDYVVPVPASMSFENMDEVHFKAFTDRAVDALWADWLPSLTDDRQRQAAENELRAV